MEVEQVAVETHEQPSRRQESSFRCQDKGVNKTYRMQASEYLAFQVQMMKSLQRRVKSTYERLEMNLALISWLTWPTRAYNMLAISDKMIMKSITLIFLPASFMSVKDSH